MEGLLYFVLGAAAMLALAWYKTTRGDFLAQKPEDLAGTSPEFELREHLKGPILCEGVIYGPTGRVSSRFVADMDARWDGNRGVMKEHFRYDTGATQDREWRLTLGNDGSIKAEADDVVGTGTGQQTGAGVQLKYVDPSSWISCGTNRTNTHRFPTV